MGEPSNRREAVRSLEYMIPECRQDLNCIVHDADIPLPKYLKDIDYHLIVLGPTFLCSRYHSKSLRYVMEEYAFIRDSYACKIALPQDDYDCSDILDNWMVDWKIDCIYTVCPEHWEVLYPRASKHIEIRLGYTGYISDEWIDSWRYPKNRADRTIDVSYRASKLPANFGRVGQLKWEIAEKFRLAVHGRAELNLDISIAPEDLIPGTKWHKFLENSKFCLATPSGSSLLDPCSDFRRCVKNYMTLKQNASFEEIEKYCFPGLDGNYLFLTISPRHLEAALAETVQIATPGGYSGLMTPREHYIPLDEKCENINEVLEMMADESFVNKLARNCKESILSEPRIRRRNIVNELLEVTENTINRKQSLVVNQIKTDLLFKKYYSEIHDLSAAYWKRRKFRKELSILASKIGISKAHRFFRSFSK